METVPMIELHRHLEAGIDPEDIALLAQRNGVTGVLSRNGRQPIEGIDVQDPESIRAYFKRISTGFKEKDGFARFLDSLGVGIGVMRTLSDLELVARQQILRQQAAGNIHTELRGSPYTYQEALAGSSEQPTMVDVINAIRQGIAGAYETHGASGAFIACFSRDKADRFGDDVVSAVVATHSEDSPVGLDIAGATESRFPPSMFREMLAPAREAGVPITIHAGEQGKPPLFETAPASFVEDAVDIGARRIGHGNSIIESGEAINFIDGRGICIESCPVSNDMMGFVPLEESPVKYLLQRGLLVTANTDDPLPFNIKDVREMLVRFGDVLGLTPEDAIQMTRNGIATAFVSPERRAVLSAKFEDLLLSRQRQL